MPGPSRISDAEFDLKHTGTRNEGQPRLKLDRTAPVSARYHSIQHDHDTQRPVLRDARITYASLSLHAVPAAIHDAQAVIRQLFALCSLH